MQRGFLRSAVAGLLAVLGAAFPTGGFILASQQDARAEAVALKPIEREFITVIRFANLWEIPMGQLAVKQGSKQVVKDVGAEIAADHTALDEAVKKLAERFDVTLPDTPTSSQQSWMVEIASKTGVEFDQTFADRLRGAHGTVFGLVSEVRAGTTDPEIRAFAEQANTIVMKHMSLLESTGAVAPDSMFAEASARTTAYPENQLSSSQIILAIVLGVVMLAGTVFVVRTFSAPGSGER